MKYEFEIIVTKKEFDIAKQKYTDLNKLYSQVQQWVYATNSLYNIEPYYNERNKYPKGRVLRKNIENYEVKHGLNANGQCIIEVSNEIFPNQRYETFFCYSCNSIRSYHYDYGTDKRIINVTDYLFSNNKLVKMQRWASRGNSIKLFKYNNDKLVEEELYQPKKRNDLENIEKRTIYYAYSDNKLLSIKEKNYFCYYRIKEKEFSELLIEARDELYTNICNALSKLKNIKIHRIAILYEVGFCFPPEIKILTENKLIANNLSINELKKQPCEWDYTLEYNYNTSLMNKLNNISQISKAKYYKLINVIADVCFELNKNINKIIQRNDRVDDLIIVHTDYDGIDIEKNIKKIINTIKND